MSRSYKKIPGFTDYSKYNYIDKRNANKKVRNTVDVPNGMFYKKLFSSYNIRDYNFLYFTKEEIRKSFYYKDGLLYKIYIK